jgi:hypothetical protein
MSETTSMVIVRLAAAGAAEAAATTEAMSVACGRK